MNDHTVDPNKKVDPATRAAREAIKRRWEWNGDPDEDEQLAAIIRRETRCGELRASVEAYVAMMRHSMREPRNASNAAYKKWQQRYYELCEDAHDKAKAALGLEDTQ